MIDNFSTIANAKKTKSSYINFLYSNRNINNADFIVNVII